MPTHLDDPSRRRPERVIETPFGPSNVIPLQAFLDNVLPPLRPGFDVRQVIESLKNNQKSYQGMTGRKRRRGFTEDPKGPDASIFATFKYLNAVVNSIVKASNQFFTDEPTLRFETSPTLVARNRYNAEETLPHASFLEGPTLSWDKIAVCGEYQKERDSESLQDTIANVTDSMVNCFQHDLRRRFVFGFGINDTDIRLWFCDRSRFLVSEPFNFLTEHIPWIHFCLSTMYAEPHQLGWDTTMIPLPDGLNFDILVRSAECQTRTYRTQTMLSGKTPRTQLGKDTKVWRAVRIENGEATGSPVALKDCWMHPDYAREGGLILDICQDALKTEDKELVARNFMHVECHGDVFIGGDEPVLDCTRTFPTDGPAHDSTSEIFKRRLVHYRLALSPAGGKSVEHEMSVQTIYRTLAHVAGSLRLMHESGWVHRDVSTGNILVGDGPRLVDFEYAKRASEENDFNIGTRFFKAFEVDREMYHYTPPPELTPGPTPSAEELRERMKALKERLRLFRARGPPNSQQQQRQTMANTNPQDAQVNPSPARAEATLPTLVPLRYNPLHDLESLWWVGAYFLLKRKIYHVVPLGGEDSDHWDREKQRKCADEVFYSTDARASIMMHDSGYFYRYVVPVVHPTMRPVAEILQDLRRALLQRYVDVEKDAASVDFTCAEGLYERFIAGFSEIENHPQLKDVLLVPLVSPPDLGAPFNAIEPPLNVLKPESEASPDQGTQTGKKEKKKGLKATRPRKPATHQYNLRPRAKRS